MSNAVIASGVVAVAVFGFAPQNRAMLAAGAERTLRAVLDCLLASLFGWLLPFGVALGVLLLLPPWAAGATSILALLFLALAGLARYVADPDAPAPPRRHSPPPPFEHLGSPESWAVAMFLAGSALTGSLTLATAFAALTLMAAVGLGMWALAGWSGCGHLVSGWHRRHLDWALGMLMFVAATASLIAEA
ncbi:hypothetical protein [Hoeflea olei]|uniref:Uncharacterized protein n=1 Tax=Hoeflea olei TaxID=1480615 RepID=A0A1C1YQI7_9HYPH|nr:hypothetical protein [Hoeflea olei]OCW55831.1 hypothetical protein AWJ14_15245 [Hoeflea olei]